ncbi:MAG TPA: ABC transporter permease subunit [Candidatus Limnocylindrales bacterium]|jgi:osmoprotectant transport system permease protein|nr:ABC transporter permease subunit [Candidatus Limnocylindrales bacterium]
MKLLTDTIGWLLDPAHWGGSQGILTRLLEHAAFSGISIAIAMAIAIPTGIWIGHTGRFASVGSNLANLGRALPSLAVIGLVLPITASIDPQLGFKVYPTLVAMVVLAIPPVLVNAQAGIAGVDRDLVEAARAMGMTERQIVRKIELPLGTAPILAGLRSASVQVIATATLGAFFGGGGLGRFLVEGIAQRDDGMTFGGVVLVGLLALTVEGAFVVLQRVIRSPGLARMEGARATIGAA